MTDLNWVEDFPAAVTVCDAQGIILTMNAMAAVSFRDQGGKRLIGSNVLDCHPEPSRTQLAEMLESGRANVYTIEKAGTKKLIYQSPWYRGGQYAGFVELALPIPAELPHFVRSS
ncbi:MAG: diguanylate cyclase [candidate division NC10 bacterium]|nr:diguanylate cyclase [candidate division NC10 bacterium]